MQITTYDEYGGFVLNTKTGKMDCLFTTNCSALLAEHRAFEKAEYKNKYQNESYDLNNIVIKSRTVMETRDEWT